MTSPLQNKSVVITGASSGIGWACSLYLDQLGFRVFAGVRKPLDAEKLHQAASEQLTPIFIDVTQPDTIKTASQQIKEAVSETGLGGLINNAGISGGGPLEFIPIADLRNLLEVNVIGQVMVTQAFLPLLRQGKGRIINMSSISGRLALPFVGPYSASKFGLEAINDALRVELKPWDIDVISIEPGAIATPIWGKTIAQAEEMVSNFSAKADQLYGHTLRATRQQVINAGENGIPADEVAKAVTHALTAKQPKTRYLIGQKAKVAALLATWLPDRVRDWLILQVL